MAIPRERKPCWTPPDSSEANIKADVEAFKAALGVIYVRYKDA